MGKTDRNAWHPAACSALEIELREYKDHLIFQREVQLNKEPMRMDLLIIKKEDDVRVDVEIGRIFRKYNIFEYKSPDDSLTIDDFCTVLSYAYWYKAHGEHVNELLLREITVTLMREGFPRKLAEELEQYGNTVRRVYPGVYYVDGLHFPCQIIATGELADRYAGLRILTRHLEERDFQHFLEGLCSYPGENADAVLQVSMNANPDRIEQFREVNPTVCEALRELMKDEIAQALAEEREKTTREVTREVTQKVTNEVTQKVTNEVTQKVSNEVSQETTRKHVLSMRAMRFADEIIAQALNLTLADVKAITST